MITSHALKFIGRKSSPCGKCKGVTHYVNPMGGISCISCYPPKKPEHVLLNLVAEAGVWTTPDQAFYSGCENSGNLSGDHSSRLTSPPQAETAGQDRQAATADPPHATPPVDSLTSLATGRVVVRRKSSEPYTPQELAWVFCHGGILDQMAAAVHTRKIPVCRSGETVDEVAERLAVLSDGKRLKRKLAMSNHGAVQAVLAADLIFVVPASSPRQYERFAAGEACLLFPGRLVPERDPEAGDIRASIMGRGKDGKRMAVVRLPANGGRLRILDEHQVTVV